jgi:uncharacterized protein (DUF1697 family)
MARYVAFLRGINLGSTNKVSMAALRALVESLGYTDVVTYINSGNLILSTTDSAATVQRRVAEAIKGQLGLEVDMAVRTPDRLARIVADNPYPDGDQSLVTVAFLVNPAGPEAKAKVAAVAADHEPVSFAGQEVYVHYTRGQGRSKLAARFSDIIGVSATVRNMRTVTKVLDLV